ncbi:retrovirus-related pol polyprotein from transposon TNT 1-94, partial [Tanacetum coccineum]
GSLEQFCHSSIISNAKESDQTECRKYGKKGHFERDCWSKALVPSYQSPFQQKPLSSSQYKPELRPTKDFEAKCNKVKAKPALLSSSASASKATNIKNKGLIAEAYKWDKEEVSSDDNEMVEVKVLMALAKENDAISKEGARNVDESSICSTPLPPLKKLDGAELISGPKTIKSILRSNSTFKVETLKGVKINEPSSAPAKGNKSSQASKVNSAPAGKLKSVKIKDDPPMAIVIKELNDLKLQISKNQSSYSRNNQQCDIKKPIWYLDSGCSRHMTGVKSYLDKYVEQPGPKVVFGDDSTCVTKGYGSIKCNGIVFTKVAFVNGLKYNLISISQLCDAKVRDVYVLDMTSSAQESCFFAKASKNLNWLWHKRLAHLNFKTINKMVKQNLVIGLPSLVYSIDKPCSSCEKGKHRRASFKTK